MRYHTEDGKCNYAVTSNVSLRALVDLKPGDHLCYLYESEEEHRALLTPFLRHGLERGEKVIYVVDARTSEAILDSLREDGIDVEQYLASGRLAILAGEGFYARDGAFDPDAAIAALRTETDRALAQGCSALRLTTEMTWSLRGIPGSERSIEFESKLNAFLLDSRCVSLCQYDRRRFDAVALLNALVTHPATVVGTTICDNFYYMPLTNFQGHDLPTSALRCWLGNLAEHKRREESLLHAKHFSEHLFDEFPTPIWRSDVDTTCDYVNQSWLTFTGRTIEQEIGDGWMEGLHPEDSERFLKTYLDAFKSRNPFQIEYRLRRFDGQYRWVLGVGRPFNNLDGNFAGYIGSCYDITERRLQEQQLAYLATHDALTGLPNRRSLEEALKRVVPRARRGVTSAILFLDVDNFKLVNDTLGHAAGDQALVTLTRLLQEMLRAGDLVVRLGGDEFAVLLEGTDVEGARIVAERMRKEVEEFCFTLEDFTFNLSLSIGLAAIDGQQPPLVMLSHADAAMYKAKEEGRNRIVLYSPDENGLARLSEANRLAARLKDGLKDGKFVLHYQPVVRLSDGQVEHYEALVRLRGNDGEMVYPGSFIPAAERFGLMPQLTRWIIQEAIHTLRQHSRIRVSVNLSGLDLSDETLPEFVEVRLRECDVEPSHLWFEITETAVVKDLALAERWIRRLKKLGCRFALDDFGTGFVSFAYLRNLPVDLLKIDGSFISVLEKDVTQRALVQSVQTLARAQGKETVAEFVENEAIAQIVKDVGITFGQGYYFGKPSADPGLFDLASRKV